MIIVKTTTGTHFVNEKLMKRVWHDKESFKVWITQLDGSVDSILHVAAVTFVSDAQPMEYNDDGSIIEAMKFKLKEMEAECNAKLEALKNENDEHKNEVMKLRSKLRDFGCEL